MRKSYTGNNGDLLEISAIVDLDWPVYVRKVLEKKSIFLVRSRSWRKWFLVVYNTGTY